jgi:RNA polymerase sigma-70 factor (ECF subfamily)
MERAEEAAQETFVRAYFALHKLNAGTSFFSWLLGIAARVAKEQHRVRRRREEARNSWSPRTAPSQAPDDEPLRRAVARLPGPYAEVIHLRYYGGLSCAEISRRMDLPVGTVTKRLSRAYAMLRDWLPESEGRGARSEVRS